jgi:hypothetical protein
MNTPTTSRDPASMDSFRSGIQIVSTILIGASTSFFVIGLQVVNLQLASYGVHNLEIDRAEYALVGVVTTAQPILRLRVVDPTATTAT